MAASSNLARKRSPQKPAITVTSRPTLTKNVDAKGRLTLGEKFANRTVIVEERAAGEWVIHLARVIPEREAWLYDHEEALVSVRLGLQQAKEGTFARKSPDLVAAKRLADQLREEDE